LSPAATDVIFACLLSLAWLALLITSHRVFLACERRQPRLPERAEGGRAPVLSEETEADGAAIHPEETATDRAGAGPHRGRDFREQARSSVIGSAQAPYLNKLAAKGASMTHSYGVTHPSQPNYLALFSGSTQGVTSNACRALLILLGAVCAGGSGCGGNWSHYSPFRWAQR
jgi:hypothetical protein